MSYRIRDNIRLCGVLTRAFSSAVSGGVGRRVNHDVEVLGPNLQWFMQYNGFRDTTVLSLYTKTGPNSTWRKYLKAKHVLDMQADGSQVLIICKLTERKKDLKVARLVKTFSYADVNKELNNEGENIHLLNGEFLTYCIKYCETNEHTKTVEEISVMIEQNYKSALRRVKVIIKVAKAAMLEATLKKKEIRDGKRKDLVDVYAISSRKKTRPDERQ